MCRYQTLFHDNTIGYVIRCHTCKNFQVGFGNVTLTFHPPDFTDFLCCIQKWQAEQQPMEDGSIKTISIPTPYQGIRLLLSQHELKDLHLMLELADVEWKSQELLKLFTG